VLLLCSNSKTSGMTINCTGPAPNPYQTAVVVLVHASDVLKHLARMWHHLPWTPGAWASTE